MRVLYPSPIPIRHLMSQPWLTLHLASHVADDAVVFLIDGDGVAGAAQLLRGGQARGPAAHHGHALAGVVLWRLGMNPALLPGPLDDAALDELDGDGGLADGEHAGGLAGRGADAAGELGEVIGGVEAADRGFPTSVVDQVVPVGNQIVDRTAGMAEGQLYCT